MPHPLMTQELVRQRRAALEAESRNQRPTRQLQHQAPPDPEHGRLAITAQTLARQARALVARPT
jgi:hypothetical protein